MTKSSRRQSPQKLFKNRLVRTLLCERLEVRLPFSATDIFDPSADHLGVGKGPQMGPVQDTPSTIQLRVEFSPRRENLSTLRFPGSAFEQGRGKEFWTISELEAEGEFSPQSDPRIPALEQLRPVVNRDFENGRPAPRAPRGEGEQGGNRSPLLGAIEMGPRLILIPTPQAENAIAPLAARSGANSPTPSNSSPNTFGSSSVTSGSNETIGSNTVGASSLGKGTSELSSQSLQTVQRDLIFSNLSSLTRTMASESTADASWLEKRSGPLSPLDESGLVSDGARSDWFVNDSPLWDARDEGVTRTTTPVTEREWKASSTDEPSRTRRKANPIASLRKESLPAARNRIVFQSDEGGAIRSQNVPKGSSLKPGRASTATNSPIVTGIHPTFLLASHDSEPESLQVTQSAVREASVTSAAESPEEESMIRLDSVTSAAFLVMGAGIVLQATRRKEETLSRGHSGN